MHLPSVKENGASWIFFTRILPPSTRQTSILWRIDNMAALSRIRKEGGLKTRILLEWAEKILLLAHQRHLRILPAFIPPEENLQADAASRFQSLPDWHLSPDVFLQITALRGLPQIDLFASRHSAQTIRFYSWDAADTPEAIDALSQIWDFDLASDSPPQESCQEVEEVKGDLPSRHPLLDAQTWFASLQALP
jgi:hypothetical protein